MTDSSSSSDAAWLQTTLSELLTTPHISFHGPPGIRLGPGPIDLFSTKFNNAFTPDVKAVVAGEQVNREGLKEKLLALQRHYNPDNVKFRTHEPSDTTTSSEAGPNEAKVSFTGLSKHIGEYDVSTSAVVVGTGGSRKISSLNLDGKSELFVKPTT